MKYPSGAEAGKTGALSAQHFALGMRSHRSGQLAVAEQHYRNALSFDPNHADSLFCLGLVALQTGRYALAIEMIGQAIALNDRQPDWHYHLAVACQSLGRSKEAAAHYGQALTLKPDLVDAHFNMGLMDMLDGRADEAMARFRQVLALDPKHAQARNNIGNLLAIAGELDKAAAIYQAVIDTSPTFVEAYENLARTFLLRGQPANGVAVLANGFRVGSTPGMKGLFVKCAQQLRVVDDDPSLRAFLLRAISDPWARPSELAGVSARVLKSNRKISDCISRVCQAWPRPLPAEDLFGPAGLTEVAGDPLLLCLLESTPVTDVELERFLSAARSALLSHATTGTAEIDDRFLKFFAALARQCFINEYVFAVTDDELACVHALRDRVDAALQNGGTIPALWLVAVAAYVPLHTLLNAPALPERSLPEAIRPLLVQQVREPQEERSDRELIRRLAPIEDRVSMSVQAQYEQNPYPRWVRIPPPVPRASLEEHLRVYFPSAPFRSLGKGGRIEILVAGCGTGQHAIELAQQFAQARILAVDLSLSSLAYARRKTREAGLTNIEYVQGDILRIGATGRSFDLIEASGVLHHMADPLAGWRALMSVLRPGGFMDIGLYSERAREAVVGARAQIAAQGYRPIPEDIRRFRQHIIGLDDGAPLKSLVNSADFFTVSACRDLLFHVQEHRYSLPEIGALLGEHRLRFLGFDLPDATLRRYVQRFPEDATMTRLDLWHVFETENPYTFRGMYQFWVQREN